MFEWVSGLLVNPQTTKDLWLWVLATKLTFTCCELKTLQLSCRNEVSPSSTITNCLHTHLHVSALIKLCFWHLLNLMFGNGWVGTIPVKERCVTLRIIKNVFVKTKMLPLLSRSKRKVSSWNHQSSKLHFESVTIVLQWIKTNISQWNESNLKIQCDKEPVFCETS